MTNPEDTSPAEAPERRRSARRHVDPPPPPQVAGERANLPVAGTAQTAAAAPGNSGAPANFAAQLIGQDGQKRGLRGGAPVLDAARAAYLGAEYSGAGDRRPRRGAITKTEI